LIQKGADINATDGNNSTPLHYAAIKGNDSTVSLLIQKGANRMLKDNKGQTALDKAIEKKHEKCISILTEENKQRDIRMSCVFTSAKSYAKLLKAKPLEVKDIFELSAEETDDRFEKRTDAQLNK
jgi:ankyrin repeat protein